MPDDSKIISDRPVDDIPQAQSIRRSEYQEYVEKAWNTRQSRELKCVDRDAGRAVYAGVLRAIERMQLEDHITATTRLNKDETTSVFITIIDDTRTTNTPGQTGKEHQ